MKKAQLFAATGIVFAAAVPGTAGPSEIDMSGNLGVFAIVDRVQFEPNEQAAERIKVFGSFAFVNLQDFRVQGRGANAGGSIMNPLGVTQATRGFLYFRLPASNTPQANITATRREWADLKAVAGTGQAVAFGEFFYLGQFNDFVPDGRGRSAAQTSTQAPNIMGEMRVNAVADTSAVAVMYLTNVGVTRLTEASHAAVVRQLREARNAR